MPGHGKGEFCRLDGCSWRVLDINAREDERAGIQNDRQSTHPGLLLVLRTVESQDRIGREAHRIVERTQRKRQSPKQKSIP